MGLFGPPDVEKMKAKGNIKGLEKALSYQMDSKISCSAAEALGELKSIRSVEQLIVSLRNEDLYVRRAAASALGKIGDACAVEPLIASLKDYKEHEEVRIAVADALSKIGDQRSVEMILIAVQDDHFLVRKAAADVYVNICMPDVVSLEKGLEHKAEDIQRSVARRLDILGWQPDQTEKGARYWIAKKEWTRCAEIGAAAVVPLLQALEGKTPINDRDHISMVGFAVENIRDPNSVPLLIAALAGGKGRYIEAEIAEALGVIGDSRSIEPLITQLVYEESSTARAILKFGRASIEPLIAALVDKKRPLEYKVVYVHLLEKLGWTPGSDQASAWYVVIKKEWTKCIALGALAIEPLITILEESINEGYFRFSYYKWRDYLETIQALDKIGDARAIPTLIKLLADSQNFQWESGERHRNPETLGNPYELHLAIAKTLLNLYQSGKLDGTDKKLILEQRKLISQKHVDRHGDETVHQGGENCGADYHTDSHNDSGIGIKFPL